MASRDRETRALWKLMGVTWVSGRTLRSTDRSHASRASTTLGSAPRAELLANRHELTEMVGVVIGDEQDLADVRLPITVRDLREQIDRLVLGERFECGAVFT